MRTPIPWLVVPLAALTGAGCATLDAMALGQTERLDGAPFVHRFGAYTAVERAVVLAPVALDRSTREAVLAPSQADAFAELVSAIDRRLAAMDRCAPSPAPLPDAGAPWVYVGSAAGETAPPEAAQYLRDWEKYPPMVLHVDRPSGDWRARLSAQPPAPAYLWVRLALVDYPGSDQGWFGKKVVLGEGHEVARPFLRAELQPLQVLQLTGVLVAPDGRVLAAGAEGIHAVDTPFTAQVFGLQREIDPAQVHAVLAELRREELPGQPLKWEAALDNLVRQLLQPR
jgi:hypothetical protein